MKKKKFSVLILMPLLLLLGLLVVSKDFRIYATSVLRTENLDKIGSIKSPILKLEIPQEVQENFDAVYNEYTDDFSSEQYDVFVEKLNDNNQWEKAKLTYLGETYNVSIKLHGKTPTQHVEGNHYSLGIKVHDKKKINGVSRFNLIVYWRIRHKSDIIKYLAELTGVYFKDLELTKVEINNRPQKLYYLEYRTTEEYFQKINRPECVVLKFKSDHSLIYTGGNLDVWDKNLKKAIKKIDLDDSLKAIIYNEYSELNKAIYEGDVEQTLSHFDLDYLAKVQAFRYLFADNGHGFMVENLLVSFNTINLKFYPFVHRDNSPYVSNIPELDSQFNGSDILGVAGPLFKVISKSELLAAKTEHYLTTLLRSGDIDVQKIDSIIKTHNSYYYSSNLKQLLGLQPTHSSTMYINRLNSLLLRPEN